MDTESSLLSAIIEKPQDTDARLVAADWYEEQSDPRAEFIRLQLALDRLPNPHPWRKELETREQELLREHRARWNAPVHRLINEHSLDLRFRARRSEVRGWRYYGGFIEELHVSARIWITHHQLLRKLGPIRRLRLRETQPHELRQMLMDRLLLGMAALDFTDSELGDDELRRLCDYFTGNQQLRILNLAGNRLTTDSANMLCRTYESFVYQLDRLILSRNQIPFQDMQHLTMELGRIPQHENGDPLVKYVLGEIETPRNEDGVREISYDDNIRYEDGHMYRDGSERGTDAEEFLPIRVRDFGLSDEYDGEIRTQSDNPWEELEADDEIDGRVEDEEEAWSLEKWEDYEAERWGRDEEEEEY